MIERCLFWIMVQIFCLYPVFMKHEVNAGKQNCLKGTIIFTCSIILIFTVKLRKAWTVKIIQDCWLCSEWPITISYFSTHEQTSKPQTNYNCCLWFSFITPDWLFSLPDNNIAEIGDRIVLEKVIQCIDDYSINKDLAYLSCLFFHLF